MSQELLDALTNKQIETAKELLNQPSIDVNYTDGFTTVLHEAIFLDDLEIIDLLWAKPLLNVNQVNSLKESPLHAAIRLEKMEIVDRLIRHPSIQINQKNGSCKTPLQLALEDLGDGEPALIKSLIAYPGISLDKKCWMECIADPLLKVEAMIKAFLTDESSDLSKPFMDKEGRNALHHAVLFDDLELVKNLLSCEKVDIHLKDRNGNTPLHLAAMSEDVEVLNTLLKHKEFQAIINQLNNSEDAPLHLAIRNNRVDNVNSLLKTVGIDVNLFSERHCNPLILAMLCEHGEILKLLVKAQSINLEAKGMFGITPVEFAIRCNISIETLSILLNAYPEGWERAFVCTLQNFKSDQENTLFHYIINNDKIKFDHLGDEINNFLRLIENGNRYLFPAALLEKCNLNCQNKALHYAVITGRLTPVKQELEKEKIDVNIPGEKGRTALHYAIINGCTQITNLLLEKKGIDINAQDDDKCTALHLAVLRKNTYFNNKINKKILKSLLSDPRIIVNLQDKENLTPLDHYFPNRASPKCPYLPPYSLETLLAPYLKSPHVVNSMFQDETRAEKLERSKALQYYVKVYTYLVGEPPVHIPEHILQSLEEDLDSEKSPIYKK